MNTYMIIKYLTMEKIIMSDIEPEINHEDIVSDTAVDYGDYENPTENEIDRNWGNRFLWGARANTPFLPRDEFEEKNANTIQMLFFGALTGYFIMLVYMNM
jgi:hypothetical protein